MAVSRSAFEQARHSAGHMQALIEYSSREAGQQRVEAWLREAGLYNKCRIGVVAIWNDLTNQQLDAWAKVIVQRDANKYQSFEHTEMYSQFPSDHFKTKVLLATGGA